MAPVEPGILEVSVKKRRGGWPVTGLRVQVAESHKPEELREQLSLWRHLRAGVSLTSATTTSFSLVGEELPQETPSGLARGATAKSDSRVTH